MIFLDTHVVVWLQAGIIDKLSKTAIDHIENSNLMISQMVRLKLQYLREIGRIKVSPDTILKELSRSIGLMISEGATEKEFYFAVECGWTRDVFDRLVVAEAEACEAILLTKDSNIRNNYAKAVW
jgi:PIN domain nuclease of toxin-antitoxin system